MEFMEFPKIASLSRECIITEKIDGTNGQIFIDEDGKSTVTSFPKLSDLAAKAILIFCLWELGVEGLR